MRKLKDVLFLCTIFFFSLISVNAKDYASTGVCKGKSNKGYYCEITGYGYGKSAKPLSGGYFETNGTDTKGKLGMVYKTTKFYTFSGEEEYAFCIDPSYEDPNSVYKYARELNLSYTADKEIYKIYKYYVNNVRYDKKNNKGDNANKYLYFTSAALRAAVYNARWNKEDEKASDIARARSKEFRNIIRPYLYNINATTVPSGYDTKYWSTTDDLIAFKDYFIKINKDLAWSDNITIKTDSYKNSDDSYTYSFNIDFGNYFADSSDYENAGFGKPYFKFETPILTGADGSGSYELSGNTIEYTPGGKIESGTKAEIKVVISDATYKTIMADRGGVLVKLQYKKYHPMNSENVFINNPVNGTAGDKRQRMIVFSKVEVSGEVSNGKKVPDEPKIPTDKDVYFSTLNKCYDSESEYSESEYSESNAKLKEFKEKYNKDEYFSELLDDLNKGQNYVLHLQETEINNYCNLKCLESIKIDNYVDSFTVKGGTIFKLNIYPKLEAKKNCRVTVDYDSFLSDYKGSLVKLFLEKDSEKNEKGYGKYKTAISKMNATFSHSVDSLNNGEIDYYSYDKYTYSIQYDRNGEITLTENTKSFYTTNPKSSIHEDEKTAAETFMSGIDPSVNDLLDSLVKCNNYLGDIGNDEKFYNFTADLDFIYSQSEYKKGESELHWFNNKEYDSKFSIKKETNESDENYKNYYKKTNKNYPTVIKKNDGSYNKTTRSIGIKTNSNYMIDRGVSYTYTYGEPDVSKVIIPFNGNTLITESNNNIIVAKGYYDTAINSCSGTEEFNYVFSSLGDNDSIFEHYKADAGVGLERTCNYEIKNNLITSCIDGGGQPKKPELNVLFRAVDSSQIDPNKRISGGRGFSNWKNGKGWLVKKEIEKTDTYNPSNVEYSVKLDSSIIEKIRNYDKENNYDNNTLTCNDLGNECISNFIVSDPERVNDNNVLFTNISGRDNWSYLYCPEDATIDGDCELRTFNSRGGLDSFLTTSGYSYNDKSWGYDALVSKIREVYGDDIGELNP